MDYQQLFVFISSHYESVSLWLKNTISGIVILGMLGSLLAAFAIRLFVIFSRLIWSLIKFVLRHTAGKSAGMILIVYLRAYFVFRANLLQLKRKSENEALIIFSQNIMSKKANSEIISFVSFFICYFMFLFFGTNYPKTEILLVTIFFLSTHDAIAYNVCWNFLERTVFRETIEISKATYASKMQVIKELLCQLEEIAAERKQANLDDSRSNPLLRGPKIKS